MAPRFAPNDPSIPENLRKRFENWDENPPKTQFQQYGPLNAFLSIKFPPNNFLVKPQALLREIWELPQGNIPEDIESYRAILEGRIDPTMDIEQDAVENIQRRVSVDSQNALVLKDKIYYPDFVVTSYGNAADPDGEGDIIRLIVEVGSLGRDLNPPSDKAKKAVVHQVRNYLYVMGRMGYRWKDKAVGMAIVGTEVSILKSDRSGQFIGGKRWYSLYSTDFIRAIEKLAAI
ncbi:hypothetical protein BYT27DRAFT_6476384 [Phlegmacium glaucopus]|nr:hypothetical protein BYT27DRAFT_6476384 [Phlegmacium glaucopus]